MARHRDQQSIGKKQANIFEKAEEQLLSFYREIGSISRKKPGEPLNKFKLGFINQTLNKANEILGEQYRPFPDFTIFDIEGSLPTASDVVMMLDQYTQAMKKFKQDHSSFGDWILAKPADDEDGDIEQEQWDEEDEETTDEEAAGN